MLRINKNTEIFEAISEVDGVTVMVFKAEVDKENPVDSSLDVKKESEQLYRQYRDVASADRAEFEDYIFGMIDELENPRPVEEPETIDGEYVDVPEAMENIANSWDQLDESEKNRVAEGLAGNSYDERIRQDCTEEEITDGTYDCIMAGR